MKLSTLGLGFAVAASSLVGIASVAPSAKAASIYADNIPLIPNINGIEFSGEWEFTYLGSYGSYQSNFGVVEDGKFTTFFSEVDKSIPGSIAGGNTAAFTFDFGKLIPNGQTAGFFLDSVSPDLAPIISGINKGFYIATAPGVVGGLSSTDPSPYNTAFQSAIDTWTPQGYRVIGVNDTFGGDKDYNDFIVKARKVPVPAIVPGIALAGVFFGSKALKRKQEKSASSVA